MPGFDRTGPSGDGVKTGRGLGRCTGYVKDDKTIEEVERMPNVEDSKSYSPNIGSGRGLGRGSGRGLGRRRG